MEYFDYERNNALLKGLTEPGVFVKSYNGVVDELNKLGIKYGVTIDNCIRVEHGKNGVAFRITEGVNAAGLQVGNLITEIFVAMHKNNLSPLEFVFVENEPRELYKLINDNAVVQGDSLSPGPRIMKIPAGLITIGWPCYQTLEDLISYDPEFREIKKRDFKWATTISMPENIIHTADYIITTPEGDLNGLNGLLLMHSITGDRGRKSFTGVHHLELPIPKFIHDFTVISEPDKHGVYIATFKIEKSNGRVIAKKEASTMFPTFWSKQQFYFECYNAIQRKESINGSTTHFRSTTNSGIPVEMYFSAEGRFRTIFPIYSGQQSK